MLRNLTIAHKRAIIRLNADDGGVVMNIGVMVMVPRFIYDIYADAAKALGDCGVDRVMAGALQAYAQYLFEDMQAKGEMNEKESPVDR